MHKSPTKKTLKKEDSFEMSPVTPKKLQETDSISKNTGSKKKCDILQDIIDYPRHIRISSDFESVGMKQHELRKQTCFHHEFDPNLNDPRSKQVLDGVYVPNQITSSMTEDQSLTEFIRYRGNLGSKQKRASPSPPKMEPGDAHLSVERGLKTKR
jgi:hypothetical protein